jgi:hypothetical protein
MTIDHETDNERQMRCEVWFRCELMFELRLCIAALPSLLRFPAAVSNDRLSSAHINTTLYSLSSSHTQSTPPPTHTTALTKHTELLTRPVTTAPDEDDSHCSLLDRIFVTHRGHYVLQRPPHWQWFCVVALTGIEPIPPLVAFAMIVSAW